MLPKDERLRSKKSFGRVYREGWSVVNRLGVLYILPGEGEKNKVGFVASRRVGRAVVRNRVKRMFRESYRQYRGDIKKGYILVFKVRRAAVGRHYTEIYQAVGELLRKGAMLEEAGR